MSSHLGLQNLPDFAVIQRKPTGLAQSDFSIQPIFEFEFQNFDQILSNSNRTRPVIGAS
jgi:hypothetical protein